MLSAIDSLLAPFYCDFSYIFYCANDTLLAFGAFLWLLEGLRVRLLPTDFMDLLLLLDLLIFLGLLLWLILSRTLHSSFVAKVTFLDARNFYDLWVFFRQLSCIFGEGLSNLVAVYLLSSKSVKILTFYFLERSFFNL